MNPICQQCGTPNISGAAFCDNCGSQFLSGDSSGNSTLAPTQVPPSPPVVVASAGPSPLARATTCSICGVPYQAGEAYCGNCGAPLPQASSSPPVVNYPAPPVMTPVAAAGNICPQCGTPNEASSVFCDNCGAEPIRTNTRCLRIRRRLPTAPPTAAGYLSSRAPDPLPSTAEPG
ncbi:MAG: zinc ribbon domain-containing protein [Candidatus Promineifilaceae bacterium]